MSIIYKVGEQRQHQAVTEQENVLNDLQSLVTRNDVRLSPAEVNKEQEHDHPIKKDLGGRAIKNE